MKSFTFSLLPLAVIGLCLQAQPSDAAPTAGPRGGASVQYTSIPAPASLMPTEAITIRIDINFTAGERTKIVEAVAQWNHALNGQIRLEVSAQPYNINAPSGMGAKTWTVSKVNGRGPGLGTLAQAQETTNGSGVISVFADKLGNRDLGQIMLHEFGHMLGLGHENAGRLMSPHYANNAQQCIDRGAMQAVAQAKRLNFAAMNWCGDSTQVAQANRR
jgi:hypothetical protein